MNLYGTSQHPFWWNFNPIVVAIWNSMTRTDYDVVRLRLN